MLTEAAQNAAFHSPKQIAIHRFAGAFLSKRPNGLWQLHYFHSIPGVFFSREDLSILGGKEPSYPPLDWPSGQ